MGHGPHLFLVDCYLQTDGSSKPRKHVIDFSDPYYESGLSISYPKNRKKNRMSIDITNYAPASLPGNTDNTLSQNEHDGLALLAALAALVGTEQPARPMLKEADTAQSTPTPVPGARLHRARFPMGKKYGAPAGSELRIPAINTAADTEQSQPKRVDVNLAASSATTASAEASNATPSSSTTTETQQVDEHKEETSRVRARNGREIIFWKKETWRSRAWNSLCESANSARATVRSAAASLRQSLSDAKEFVLGGAEEKKSVQQ